MLKLTKYPKGSIQTREQLEKIICNHIINSKTDMVLYCVHHINNNSFMNKIIIKYEQKMNPLKITFHENGYIDYTITCINDLYPNSKTNHHLGDYNILKNTYNDHFMFYNQNDAQRYLDYCLGYDPFLFDDIKSDYYCKCDTQKLIDKKKLQMKHELMLQSLKNIQSITHNDIRNPDLQEINAIISALEDILS